MPTTTITKDDVTNFDFLTYAGANGQYTPSVRGTFIPDSVFDKSEYNNIIYNKIGFLNEGTGYGGLDEGGLKDNTMLAILENIVDNLSDDVIESVIDELDEETFDETEIELLYDINELETFNLNQFTELLNKSNIFLRETEVEKLFDSLDKSNDKILDYFEIMELLNYLYEKQSHAQKNKSNITRQTQKEICDVHIDTRLRRDYYNTIPTNFVYHLPEIQKNVINMSIGSIELPQTNYTISSKLGNNTMLIMSESTSRTIETYESASWSFHTQIGTISAEYLYGTIEQDTEVTVTNTTTPGNPEFVRPVFYDDLWDFSPQNFVDGDDPFPFNIGLPNDQFAAENTYFFPEGLGNSDNTFSRRTYLTFYFNRSETRHYEDPKWITNFNWYPEGEAVLMTDEQQDWYNTFPRGKASGLRPMKFTEYDIYQKQYNGYGPSYISELNYSPNIVSNQHVIFTKEDAYSDSDEAKTEEPPDYSQQFSDYSDVTENPSPFTKSNDPGYSVASRNNLSQYRLLATDNHSGGSMLWPHPESGLITDYSLNHVPASKKVIVTDVANNNIKITIENTIETRYLNFVRLRSGYIFPPLTSPSVNSFGVPYLRNINPTQGDHTQGQYSAPGLQPDARWNAIDGNHASDLGTVITNFNTTGFSGLGYLPSRKYVMWTEVNPGAGSPGFKAILNNRNHFDTFNPRGNPRRTDISWNNIRYIDGLNIEPMFDCSMMYERTTEKKKIVRKHLKSFEYTRVGETSLLNDFTPVQHAWLVKLPDGNYDEAWNGKMGRMERTINDAINIAIPGAVDKSGNFAAIKNPEHYEFLNYQDSQKKLFLDDTAKFHRTSKRERDFNFSIDRISNRAVFATPKFSIKNSRGKITNKIVQLNKFTKGNTQGHLRTIFGNSNSFYVGHERFGEPYVEMIRLQSKSREPKFISYPISENPKLIHKIKFNVDKFGNEDNVTNIQGKLGWALGFRSAEYLL